MAYNQNYSSEITRILPSEISSAGGYAGQYEASNTLSSMAASVVDRQILEHENPNRCNPADLAPALHELLGEQAVALGRFLCSAHCEPPPGLAGVFVAGVAVGAAVADAPPAGAAAVASGA